MDVIQNFSSDSLENTLFMCGLYVVLGCIGILANIINIIIFISNKSLRTNFIFHIILDMGEIINGLSYVFTGVGRGISMLNETFYNSISVHDCFFHRIWPIFLILGTQVPSFIMLIMSAERIVAVQKPVLYKIYFDFKLKVLLVILLVLVQTSILCWAGLSAINNEHRTSTQHCAIISSTSKSFATFHFIFDVAGYFISFVSLLIIYVIQRIHHQNSHTNNASHKVEHHILIYMFVSLFDVVLCAAPSVVMIGSLWQLFTPGNILVSLTYATTGFISLVHTINNYIFFSEYRNQVQLIISHILGRHGCTGMKTRVSNAHVHI